MGLTSQQCKKTMHKAGLPFLLFLDSAIPLIVRTANRSVVQLAPHFQRGLEALRIKTAAAGQTGARLEQDAGNRIAPARGCGAV